MRSLLPAAFLVCALTAQEPTPTFHATSELVLLDVQVLHAKTRTPPAATLKPADFRVFEEGVAQQIVAFSHDQLPLSVVFLFDLTDSVRPVLKALSRGAKTALGHFKPADEVCVMAYEGQTRVVDGFTIDRVSSAEAIGKAAGMRLGGGAYFNNALYRAAGQLRNH